MAKIARTGDTGVGTCRCHKSPISTSGVIQASEARVFADGLSVARVGDIVVAACGHSGVIVSGSGKVFADGIAIARVGDSFVGCFSGVIVSGSGKTDSI
jgi:uncharacterized Zn-binding protein involved in type VI secretion